MNVIKKHLSVILAILPLVFIFALICLRNLLLSLSAYFPDCRFRSQTGLLCPACGNTRCVISMLNGHFITALQYNMIPPVLCILAVAGYIELFLSSAGIRKKLIPRNYIFLAVLLTATALYLVLRNCIPWLTIA